MKKPEMVPSNMSAVARFGRRLLGNAPRAINLGLLVGSFGLGQGSIFVVQTILVAAEEFRLLAAFGAHYSFAILAILLVDAGANTILARAVAHPTSAQLGREEVWNTFTEITIIRGGIAILLAAASFAYAQWLAIDAFSARFVAWSAPAYLLWATNGIGLLDGLKLSGISGATGATAYIAMAVGLFAAMGRSDSAAGTILGAAFTAGYLVALAGQWAALVARGWRPRFRAVAADGLRRTLVDGLALLVQLVPGQLHARFQLVLSATYLGAETTALFIYAKQLVTAATQIVGFVLRIEFPSLVQMLHGKQSTQFARIMSAQRLALFVAIGLVGVVAACGYVALMIPALRMAKASEQIMLFAPTILSVSLSLMMIQALSAIGAYRIAAGAIGISALAGMAASYLLLAPLKLYAFLLGDLVFHGAGFLVVYVFLRPARRVSM